MKWRTTDWKCWMSRGELTIGLNFTSESDRAVLDYYSRRKTRVGDICTKDPKAFYLMHKNDQDPQRNIMMTTYLFI